MVEPTGSESDISFTASTTSSDSISNGTSGSLLLRLTERNLNLEGLQDIYKRASALRNEAHYTEALPLYCQVLSGYEHLLGPDHEDVLDLVHRVAHVHTRLSSFTEAGNLYRRAAVGYKHMFGPSSKKALLATTDLARTCVEQGHSNDAIRLYIQTLSEVEPLLSATDTRLLLMFCELGRNYGNHGNFPKARFWLRRAIAGYRILGAEYDDEVLHVEVNLALCSINDKEPAAESMLTDLLKVCQNRYRAEDHTFMVFTAIQTRYRVLKNYDKLNLLLPDLWVIIQGAMASEEELSSDKMYAGVRLAQTYSLLGNHKLADTLFTQLQAKRDTSTLLRTQWTDTEWARIRFGFTLVHAEHHMRRRKWEDAVSLLRQAKSLERLWCRPSDSRRLAKALNKACFELTLEALAKSKQGPRHRAEVSRRERRSTEPIDDVIFVGSSSRPPRHQSPRIFRDTEDSRTENAEHSQNTVSNTEYLPGQFTFPKEDSESLPDLLPVFELQRDKTEWSSYSSGNIAPVEVALTRTVASVQGDQQLGPKPVSDVPDGTFALATITT